MSTKPQTYWSKYYQEHKAQRDATNKKYKEAHPDKVKQRQALHREKNRAVIRAKHKAWRDRNKAKIKAYYKKDYAKRHDAIKAKRKVPVRVQKLARYQKRWRANNVEKRRADLKRWHFENPNYAKEYRVKYKSRRLELYQQQRERICAQKKAAAPKYRKRVQEYQRRQRRENVQFCLKDRLRATMSRALRRQFVKKSSRTFELIGCTPTDFKIHLENLFLPGMTWANRNLWHVDHKRPLALFDLRDVEQQKIAFHFTNTQPLWGRDNQSKSSKWSG